MTEAAGPVPDESDPAAGRLPIEVDEPEAAWRQAFTGLLHIGELAGWFDYLGHRVRIRTLRTSEELIISELVRRWGDTIGGTKAFATAMVALAVSSVDGQLLPVPLGETSTSAIDWAEERFNFAQRWYPSTIDEFYSRYLELEARAKETFEGLGKESGPGDATPGSSAPSGSPSAGDSSGETASP